MRKFFASVALGAVLIAPLHADPGGGKGGGGNGGGHGGGHGNAGGAAQGGGHPGGGNANKGSGGPGGNGRGHGGAQVQAASPGNGNANGRVQVQRQQRGNGNGGGNGQAMRPDRGQAARQRATPGNARAERQVARPAYVEQRGNGNGNGGGKANRVRHDDGGRQVFVQDSIRSGSVRNRGGDRQLIAGCPPGLAKKNNGCLPPGLARTAPVQTVVWQQPAWYGADWYGDRYRYHEGYMLRMGANDSVLSYVPLLGGALAIGELWPGDYQPVALPDYYRTFYELGPADSYRYYDDTIYAVDEGDTGEDLITSVIALLTGDEFDIGDPLPDGYDVYNVPYEYRDQYVDGPEAMYRYSDGYVYEVDPRTQLVQAAIQLLTA